MRCDAVSARLVGMHKIRSEDALRRALARMDAEQSRSWLQPQLLTSVRAALVQPWILDIDATIKPLFGHQEGAEIGYNPHKPGRPSHVLHTYWVSTLRVVLDVVVSCGKEHSASHALPGLIAILDSLAPHELPHLVRGDCAFGNEPFIDELEQREQPYLFRLRQTANVKKILTRLFTRSDWTRPTQASQGFSAIEDRLKLVGWSQERRVVILRRPAKSDLVIIQTSKDAAIAIEPARTRQQSQSVGIRRLGNQLRLFTRSHRPTLSRSRRLRKRLRRAQKSVGMGRLYDARYQPMPNQCTCHRADLQLVEWVLPRRQTGPAHGSHHQPRLIAGRSRKGGQPRRPNDHLPDHDTRCQNHFDEARREHSCGFAVCKKYRGAVTYGK